MKNFKPETFVNGTPEECVLMLKALEIAGHKVVNTCNCNANHIWYDSDDVEWHDSSSIACKTHELPQSEIYEITRPEYWCVSRDEITDEFKEWFIQVSDYPWAPFNFRYYGRKPITHCRDSHFGGNQKSESLKQIPIALWQKWFYEPYLAKKQPDFNILNETDVFFVELEGGNNWLFQGNNLTENGYGVNVSIQTGGVYYDGKMCYKESIKYIRKATPEEIETYKEHFKFVEHTPEFDPSLPFEVSNDGVEWSKFGDMYVGSDLRNGFPHVVSNGSRFEEFKHIRNIQPTEVKMSEIEAVQVDGELITNFKIVNE